MFLLEIFFLFCIFKEKNNERNSQRQTEPSTYPEQQLNSNETRTTSCPVLTGSDGTRKKYVKQQTNHFRIFSVWLINFHNSKIHFNKLFAMILIQLQTSQEFKWIKIWILIYSHCFISRLWRAIAAASSGKTWIETSSTTGHSAKRGPTSTFIDHLDCLHDIGRPFFNLKASLLFFLDDQISAINEWIFG